MSGFSAFVLTTTGSNILFRSNPKRQSKWKLPVQQLSIFVTGRGGNSMTHRVMAAAVKLHLNATYAQHLALKSVYEKRHYVMGGKLFSSKVIFEVEHVFEHPKEVT